MKKKYEAPRMEITEFRFSEHIAASNVAKCKTYYTDETAAGTSGSCSSTFDSRTN